MNGRRYREDRVKKLYEAAALLADRKEQVRMRTVDQERKLAAIEGDLAACEQAVGDILVKVYFGARLCKNIGALLIRVMAAIWTEWYPSPRL
jgi:hypothetical protein